MSWLMPHHIALCVPAYQEQLVGFAAAIAALSPPPGALLAVDDGSQDGTCDRLRAAGFEVIVLEQNQGLGSARNRLWKWAQELGFAAVCYLDADVQPPADYVQRVCQLLEPGFAGVGGRNLDEQPLSRADQWRARFWSQQLGETPLKAAPMLVGACASYRIKALDAVDGFDPRHRSHGEDVDLGRRLCAQGRRLRYEPALRVRHLRHDSQLELLKGCYLHCREGMRATLRTPGLAPGPGSLVGGMARKSLRAPLAALFRRADLGEAILGSAACGAGMLGYAVGLIRPQKTPKEVDR